MFEIELGLKAIGVIGFILYLASYYLLQMGHVSGSSHMYRWLNLLAACAVLISLFAQFNLASALIQISWIIISLIGFLRHTSEDFAKRAA